MNVNWHSVLFESNIFHTISTVIVFKLTVLVTQNRKLLNLSLRLRECTRNNRVYTKFVSGLLTVTHNDGLLRKPNAQPVTRRKPELPKTLSVGSTYDEEIFIRKTSKNTKTSLTAQNSFNNRQDDYVSKFTLVTIRNVNYDSHSKCENRIPWEMCGMNMKPQIPMLAILYLPPVGR